MSTGDRGVLGDELYDASRLQWPGNDRGLLRTTLVGLMVSATVMPEKQQQRNVAVHAGGGSGIHSLG